MAKTNIQKKKIAENLLLWQLRSQEAKFKLITENLSQHQVHNGTFTGSNIEDLINVTAEIKQLAVELELFVDANYGKESV
jgi:hypothetical protein